MACHETSAGTGQLLRILHVDSARSWRGGQNQVLLTARGQAALGHDVALVCHQGGPLESRAREARLAISPVAFRGDLSPLAAAGLAAVARSFRPEVTQLHDPHAVSAGVLAAPLAKLGPLCATRRVDFPLRSALSRTKYRRCQRVVAVSHAIARVLAEGGIPHDHVRVVHEGVADRPARSGGREALQALGVPAGAPVVGNVAALTDHKDHATLLAAAARVVTQLPQVRFVVLGEGELRPELEAQRRDLGLEDHVVFAGFRDDLDALFAAFDVFCLSSHQEGLGTSLLDAMCFGRAIVATAAGGIPEAVEDGVTGRVTPVRDVEALAAALCDVLRDPELRARFGAAGRARFVSRFEAGRMVAQTLSVYEELL